jgi:membrane fusion protein (multidrug efflux system)
MSDVSASQNQLLKAPPASQNSAQHSRRARWPSVLAGLLLLAFFGFVLLRIFIRPTIVWTDDAYVSVHYATISSRVSGKVASVLVDDNQKVTAGQTLVLLDDRDSQTAIDEAEAVLARGRAQLRDADVSILRQPSVILAAQAKVAAIRADLAFADQDARRYSYLATTGAGTSQRRQSSGAALSHDEADLAAAQANVEAEQTQLAILEADRAAADANVNLGAAALRQARLNLSYTRVRAPMAGTISERSVQLGNFVMPGSPLMALVPLDAIYIVANYREIALRDVRPGQPASVHVDAYGIDLRGVVDALPPASGATFDAIASDNATGNFTKIVQRLPLRIRLLPHQASAKLLQVGLSVETSIDTKSSAVPDSAQQGK